MLYILLAIISSTLVEQVKIDANCTNRCWLLPENIHIFDSFHSKFHVILISLGLFCFLLLEKKYYFKNAKFLIFAFFLTQYIQKFFSFHKNVPRKIW